MTVLSKRLNEEMHRLGMDQTEFAEHIDMSQGPLSRWMDDKFVPAKDNWFTMAFELDISFAEAVLIHKKAKDEKGQKTTTNYEKLLRTGSYEEYVPGWRLDRKRVPSALPRGKLKKSLNRNTDWHAHADGEKTFPIRGYAAGGADGRLIMADEPVARATWPRELERAKNAYGVFVSGDSMKERYRHGTRLHLNPDIDNIRAGDGVVIQVRDASTGDRYGYVKEYVKKTARDLVLRQYNPPMELRFPLKDVVAIHRVVGTFEP